MSNIDVFKSGLAAFEARDTKKVDGLIADDFQLTGPMPQPLGKREFVSLQIALIDAMPDWKFNVSDIKEDGDKVTARAHISGTQTAPLNLPALGIHSFAATGKHVQLPFEQLTVTIKNGKLSRLESDNVKGAGVAGVLAQIGAPMQTAQH
jgi:predicted ester cyclase